MRTYIVQNVVTMECWIASPCEARIYACNALRNHYNVYDAATHVMVGYTEIY